jgi:hypothetical protein
VEIDGELLNSLYWDQSLSLRKMSEKLGISEESLRRRMKVLGIPRRNKTWKCAGWNSGGSMKDSQRKALSKRRKEMYASGELEHWNKGKHWPEEVRKKISNTLLGGRTPSPSSYGPDWVMQRTSCLTRDNHTCQQCGDSGPLEVHHWEPYRFSFDNSLENLVTLCADCHRGIHVTYRKEGFIQESEDVFYG